MTETEGRVIKAVGGLYTVDTARGAYNCNLRGIFRKRGFTPLVGDIAIVGEIDENRRAGTITRFRERRSALTRPRVANVDQAVITLAAADPEPSPDMLDRFLLLAEDSGIEAVICLNKTDISGGHEWLYDIYARAGYGVFPVSAKTGEGLGALCTALAGKVSVLAGPSGVGKSSVVNAVLASERMETGELSRKLGRGKHTTRHAELIALPGGAFVADTPGFTSLELSHIPKDGLARLFREFLPFIGECRFGDCRHINEPGCAVKEQVGAAVSARRYGRYTAIWNELSR